jgi:hypothetical protein
MKLTLRDALETEFYCDACVEMTNEPKVEAHLSPTKAESKRATLRREEASR